VLELLSFPDRESILKASVWRWPNFLLNTNTIWPDKMSPSIEVGWPQGPGQEPTELLWLPSKQPFITCGLAGTLRAVFLRAAEDAKPIYTDERPINGTKLGYSFSGLHDCICQCQMPHVFATVGELWIVNLWYANSFGEIMLQYVMNRSEWLWVLKFWIVWESGWDSMFSNKSIPSLN
jgi:hypothetical protein